MTSPTQQAIRAVKAGMTQAEAAREFNVTRQAVNAGLKYNPSSQPRGRRKKLPDDQGRLQCSKCKEWKEPEAFGPGSCSNGKSSQCKACVNEGRRNGKNLEARVAALEEWQRHILERLNNLSLEHTSFGG